MFTKDFSIPDLRIISQDQFRLYSLCSEKFFLTKAEVESNPKLLLVEKAFEYFFLQNLDEYPFPLKTNSELLDRAMVWLGSQVSLNQSEYTDVALKGAVLFNDFMKTISLKNYLPIYGPFDQNIKLKRLVIRTHLSGIARTEKGMIRGWVFSPYPTERDVLWDPIHRIHYEQLLDISSNQEYQTSNCLPILYIGYLSDKGFKITSIDKIESKASYQKRLSLIDSMIANDIHHALSPCSYYQCPVRRNCQFS